MSLTTDDLQAIAVLLDEKLDKKLDEKLEPIEKRLTALENEVKYISVNQLENDIIPRLNTMESCYVSASKAFVQRTEQIDDMQQNVDVLNRIVTEHSQQLQKLSS